MQSLRIILVLIVTGSVLAGCSSSGTGYDANPAGAEANSGKNYTAEDAAAAQPKRGGSEGAGGATTEDK